jgi:A/G-specific adenine glycosylase
VLPGPGMTMKRPLSAASIRQFRKSVYSFYKRHGRSLPWRRDLDPCHVFVSEIMLQQTQVDRVAQKFGPFIKALPGFASIAKAPFSKVLGLWQGLGYNRRALNLKRAAEIILREYGGTLPSSPEILETLPGVGRATAASIAAFAFNKPVIFLETNIRAALIHHFFKGGKPVRDAELLPVAGILLDRTNARKWYSALMDYGSMLKKNYGNAARRSAHYKKQGRFEGSKRQKRGKIIYLLLNRKMVTSGQISRLLEIPQRQLTGILGELIRDGIIMRSKNRYHIA